MELLKFEKDTLTNFINYECKLPRKIKKSFGFVVEKLGEQNVKTISKLKWKEGKNYDWAALRSGNIRMLIRKYHLHFTFYCEFTKFVDHPYKDVEFSIFTYYSDTDLLKTDQEKDARCDDNFIDIDESFDSMLKIINEGRAHLLWNSYSVNIPKHVEIKIAMLGPSIYSFDKLVFAAEELSNIEIEVFAEIDMWNILKKIKVGDMVGKSKISGISKTLKDDYYHGLGITLSDDNSFKDVYSLTNWYLEDMLKLI